MSAPVFIHPRGLCESETVGEGTRIWANAHVMRGAIVGRHVNVGECSFVESGAVIGDHCTIKNGVSVWDCVTLEDCVFLGPNAVLTNDLRPRAHIKKGREAFAPTLIRRGATIGANATIVCGVTVGRSAMVGAGAVVTRDVPDHALVYGSPAKQHGWVCECGESMMPERACACGRKYRLADGCILEITGA